MTETSGTLPSMDQRTIPSAVALAFQSTTSNQTSSLSHLWQRVRELFHYAPTPRYAAVVAVCAPVWLFSGYPLGEVIAVTISVLLLLAGIIDAIRIPGNTSVTLTRSLPSLVGVGEEAQGSYTVQSRWLAPMRVEVHHRLPSAVVATLSSAHHTLPPSASLSLPLLPFSLQERAA